MSLLTVGNRNPVRVFRPWEFEAILNNIPRVSIEQATNLKVALLTGARYVELQLLQRNPSWFDGEFVVLPGRKWKAKKRWVRLNPIAQNLLPPFFISRELPTSQAWGQNLRRWARKAGINPNYISAKTTRKTWESWLVFCYPDLFSFIMMSQGHSEITSFRHYMNLGFKKSDAQLMRKWTSGWDDGLRDT